MKTLLTLMIAVSAATAAAQVSATTVEPRRTTEWRVVGFTRTLTSGVIRFDTLWGTPAMHALCASEVAPNARACFTSEAARSFLRPDLGIQFKAWVVPSHVSLIHDAGADTYDWVSVDAASGIVATERSPFLAQAQLHCGGYRNDTSQVTGAIVTAFGATLRTACDQEFPVACCSPVVVPASPPE